MMRTTLLLLLLLTPVLAVAAGPPVRGGGQAVIALKGDASTLNPLLSSDNSSSVVNELLFEGLVRREKNPQGDGHHFAPALAQEWRQGIFFRFRLSSGQDSGIIDRACTRIAEGIKLQADQAPFDQLRGVERLQPESFQVDCRTMETRLAALLLQQIDASLEVSIHPYVVFHLRTDVLWHDGAPFTAEDVRFTYNAAMDPGSSSHRRSSYEMVEKLEVMDRFTVRVQYRTTFPKTLDTWVTGIVPAHILAGENLTSSLFNRYPVGTGPFRFEDWAINDYIILSANENYWRGRPQLDRIVLRIIPDEAHMFLELLSGQVDIMRMKPDQFEKASSNPLFSQAFRTEVVLEPEYTYIGWNLEREIFQDPRVRQAITRAIDRKQIVQRILRNFGEVISGPFWKRNWANDPSIEALPFSPDESRRLLAEAGWTDIDGDGVLEKDMGNYHLQAEFTLMTNAGNKDRELTANFVRDELARIGIRVQIRFEEWTNFINNYIDTRQFDAILLAWGVQFDPDDSYDVWRRDGIPDPATGKLGLNAISFVNDEVEKHFQAGRLSLSIPERQPHYFRIHRIIHDLQPYTFLYSAQSLFAVSRRLQDVKINEISLTYQPETWRVADGESDQP